ncbi:ribosome biogenesis GTPase Der [Chrysiogenes arsenatis]|uniref:ribosome biogenesis GTPase Der n=1 Tax=Chrysiogenes arsenatis TaxID=309797 RepID=UPI0004297DC8|nr:ribosome biogenesis GTPase Der [Chrysiogenes arsenatis]
MKKPMVCIVGRPNVGKSTLFNRIVRKRVAIVEDIPGVTRDRNYHDVEWDEKPFTIVDTGGFELHSREDMSTAIVEQTKVAIEEADQIIFLLDAKDGITPDDFAVMDLLRRREKNLYVVINKVDNDKREQQLLDFYQLGIDKYYAISATHGLGVTDLMNDLTADFCTNDEREQDNAIRIAIIGKPNVGKSSLINKICGKERVVASPIAGTTRDTTHTRLTYNEQDYILLDTAGIRRKSKAYSEHLEKYSVLRSLNAIEESHVVVLVIDAQEGITDQDLKVASYAWDAGRPVIIAVNKWDLVEKETMTYREFEKDIDARFKFSSKPEILFLSALTGQRVRKIFDLARDMYHKASTRISTSQINELIQGAIAKHQPPVHTNGRRIKFYYGTQIATNPMIVVLFFNYPDAVHFSYERYLTNTIRDAYDLYNIPIVLKIRQRTGGNKEHEA